MREEGYYWVNTGLAWIIGFHSNDEWMLAATEMIYPSSYFDEIDERRIERGVKCTCKNEQKHGETTVSCCNHCGKPTEYFWK